MAKNRDYSAPGCSSDKVIIVGAHFDRVSEGDGVVDNWSGASLLPSLYEAVKIEPRNIGFTDEEQGEVGSRFYVRQMTKEQVAATDAMVNMDTLGLAPTEVWLLKNFPFAPNSQNWGHRKCTGDPRKSFVGLPDAICFCEFHVKEFFNSHAPDYNRWKRLAFITGSATIEATCRWQQN